MKKKHEKSVEILASRSNQKKSEKLYSMKNHRGAAVLWVRKAVKINIASRNLALVRYCLIKFV